MYNVIEPGDIIMVAFDSWKNIFTFRSISVIFPDISTKDIPLGYIKLPYSFFESDYPSLEEVILGCFVALLYSNQVSGDNIKFLYPVLIPKIYPNYIPNKPTVHRMVNTYSRYAKNK